MSFGDLPPEVRLLIGTHVVNNAFNGDNSGADAFLSAIREVESVSMMNKHMAAIMHRCTEQRFDGISPWRHYAVRAHLTHWIPIDGGDHSDHDTYWFVHLGHTWPQTTDIKPLIKWFDKSGGDKAIWIRADIRVRDSNKHGGSRGLPEMWQDAVDFLARIPTPNPALKILHLIFSASPKVVGSITNILRMVPQLTEIVLICDTAIELLDFEYPVLDLDAIYTGNEEGAQLERFLIRAPVLRVVSRKPETFFKKLGSAHTVCLAVHRIMSNIRTWEWTLDLLNAAPEVKAFEISESQPWDPIQYHNTAPRQNKYVKIELKNLFHLTLSSYCLDGQFFTRLNAPSLKYLRVRTVSRIGKAGYCDKNHFPSLLVATIWSAGPAIERFEAIGLGKSQFLHNITRSLWSVQDHNEEVLAYLKRYDPDVDSFYDNYPPAHMLFDLNSDADTMSVTSAEDDSDEEGPEDVHAPDAGDQQQAIPADDSDDSSSMSSLTSLGTTSDEDSDYEETHSESGDSDDIMEDDLTSDGASQDQEAVVIQQGLEETASEIADGESQELPLSAMQHVIAQPTSDQANAQDFEHGGAEEEQAVEAATGLYLLGLAAPDAALAADGRDIDGSTSTGHTAAGPEETCGAAGVSPMGVDNQARESNMLALSSGDEEEDDDDEMLYF
ncbi:hypothetical protein CF319_g7297 [Tilletia indica]|uniref:Uncharacterized protein n=1 Tax=Tilletia indica TaxID=43049 RepID=A0A177T5V4_9BASI|nr:hypothetical protein CF319_g7297 [Tilletia indica]KAE8230712.1 hypothetical protein CF326_g4282 [Tilletia indica]KAE8244702.1 hypothetical protein A4X13_0g6351 [Tilletia indica]